MVRWSVPGCLLLLVTASLLVMPQTVGQGAEDRAVDEDATGDVSAYGPAGPVEGVPLATPLAAPIDLVGAWIGDETPTRISFGLQVADMSRPQTPLLQGLTYVLCFERSATGDRYAIVAKMGYGASVDVAPSADPHPPILSIKKLAAKAGDPVDEAGCDVFGTSVSTWTLTGNEVELRFLPEEDRLQVDVPRTLFPGLGRDKDGNGGDPLPMAGETFTLVRAYASHRQGPATVHYDETPGKKAYTLRSDTGNRGLLVHVPDSFAFLFPGRESLAVPVYGVEIGGLQAVPFTLSNELGKEAVVDIDVEVIAGEAAKWRFQHLDRITLGSGNGNNETLTLVASGDPTLAHKERVRLLIRATTPEAPEALGVAVVDVMGVVPPTRNQARLNFHSAGKTCDTNGFWVNTLRSDGPGATVPFIGCSYGEQDANLLGALGTVGEVSRTFRPDVPFQRDYVLDASGSAPAELALKAVHRTPRTGEVPFPVKADLLVQVFSGGTPIGEGLVKDAEIDGDESLFPVDVFYRGSILQPDRLVVEDGSRLAVRVTVTSESRTIVIGGCTPVECVPEREEDVGPPPARIEMVLGPSGIELPILESRSASPYFEMRESGALLTLRGVEGEKRAYMNPGKDAVRALELRNEGLNPDTAKLGAEITVTRMVDGVPVVQPDGGGWKVAFSPKTSFPLAIGERTRFEVKVTPPADAVEGETLALEVNATSTLDKGMVVRLPYEFTVTKQQEIDGHGFETEPDDVEKDTPAPSLVFLLVALLALVAAARRRRG